VQIDQRFTAAITKDKTSGWTCVEWPDSVRELGTGKSVKVSAVIDGHTFQATFLPIGGMHMLPLRAAVLKAAKKGLGDTVEIHLTERL
jgi:hypothetical protein